MSAHLAPEDLIAAVDGALPPPQQAHLDGCAACGASLAETRDALGAVGLAGDVPEPSPFFWEQLSARVREATRDATPSRRESWWILAWKPLAAGCAAATLLWAAGVRPPRPPAVPVANDAAVESLANAATWDDVVARLDTLSVDDISTVASMAPGTLMLVEDLTPAERDALASLLERELGRLQ